MSYRPMVITIHEYDHRVVSFIHAIISSAFGISALILEIQAFSDPVSGWTPRFDKVLAFSYGYFIFDLVGSTTHIHHSGH